MALPLTFNRRPMLPQPAGPPSIPTDHPLANINKRKPRQGVQPPPMYAPPGFMPQSQHLLPGAHSPVTTNPGFGGQPGLGIPGLGGQMGMAQPVGKALGQDDGTGNVDLMRMILEQQMRSLAGKQPGAQPAAPQLGFPRPNMQTRTPFMPQYGLRRPTGNPFLPAVF